MHAHRERLLAAGLSLLAACAAPGAGPGPPPAPTAGAAGATADATGGAGDVTRVVIASHLYSVYQSGRERHPVPRIMWPEALEAFGRELERLDPDAVFLLGDTTRYSTEEEWALLERAFAPVRERVHVGLGNHDLRDLDVFARHGGLRNASVVVGRSKFVQLDCKVRLEEEDLAFLRRELADADAYEHVFLLVHYFLANWTHAGGATGPDAPGEALTNWNDDVAPLIAGKVDLVFVGDHTNVAVRNAVQRVGDERIQYVLNAFSFGRDQLSPAGGNGPMVYLELTVRGHEVEVLPRCVPFDARHPWYGMPLAGQDILVFKPWSLLVTEVPDARMRLELSFFWRFVPRTDGGIEAVYLDPLTGGEVRFELAPVDRALASGEADVSARWTERLAADDPSWELLSVSRMPVAGRMGRWARLRGAPGGVASERWSRLVGHAGRPWSFTLTVPDEASEAYQPVWSDLMQRVELLGP